jgi:hypothetical protein
MARPWPSVENQRLHDRASGTKPVRYASVDTATWGRQRPKVTHHGTEKKRPASFTFPVVKESFPATGNFDHVDQPDFRLEARAADKVLFRGLV